MSVRWRKLGHVFTAAGHQPWAASHAYCPTAYVTADGERIRVLCAFLDADRIGRCGWVDVGTADPTVVVGVSAAPALGTGIPGTFDEHGVTPLSVVRLDDGRLRLYYAGWQRGVGVRYFLFTGAAESDDDGHTFRRVSRVPVLDRSDGELHIRSGILVRRDDAAWRAWYAGGSGWTDEGDASRPRYALRHVTSLDGLAWPSAGEICLEPRDDELGFGRPCIVETDGTMRMWFGRRHIEHGYDLAYAESQDGIRWSRNDDGGLARGEPGAWDAEMVGLSSLVRTGLGTLLFYNGNGYGATGFGVAVAEGL